MFKLWLINSLENLDDLDACVARTVMDSVEL